MSGQVREMTAVSSLSCRAASGQPSRAARSSRPLARGTTVAKRGCDRRARGASRASRSRRARRASPAARERRRPRRSLPLAAVPRAPLPRRRRHGARGGGPHEREGPGPRPRAGGHARGRRPHLRGEGLRGAGGDGGGRGGASSPFEADPEAPGQKVRAPSSKLDAASPRRGVTSSKLADAGASFARRSPRLEGAAASFAERSSKLGEAAASLAQRSSKLEEAAARFAVESASFARPAGNVALPAANAVHGGRVSSCQSEYPRGGRPDAGDSRRAPGGGPGLDPQGGLALSRKHPPGGAPDEP